MTPVEGKIAGFLVSKLAGTAWEHVTRKRWDAGWAGVHRKWQESFHSSEAGEEKVNAAFGEFFCRKAVFGDYRNAMFANNAFRVFLINVFTARTVLLLGCSLTDPDLLAFLGALTFHTGGHLGGRPLRADAHERHVLHCAAQRRNAVWNSHSGR